MVRARRQGVSSILLGVAVAVALAVGLWWLSRPRRDAATPEALRTKLVHMTGDRAVAQRLIERMRKRHPDADEAKLIALAIAELRRDRRH